MIRFTTIEGAVELTATARDIDGIARRMARELGIKADDYNCSIRATPGRAADGSYRDYRYDVRGGRANFFGIVRVYAA